MTFSRKAGVSKRCAYCGTDFVAWGMSGKYCGRPCYFAARGEKRVKDGLARCAKCGDWKPVAEFVKNGARPHSYCKPCNAKYMVPDGVRKVAYRPAYTVSPEEKAATKREANQRQHHKRRVAGKPPTRDQLDALYCAQEARCTYCGDDLPESPHLDHKMPVSKGGTNALENLHFTCPTCNMRKGAMTHEEFLVSKKRPVRSWS